MVRNTVNMSMEASKMIIIVRDMEDTKEDMTRVDMAKTGMFITLKRYMIMIIIQNYV